MDLMEVIKSKMSKAIITLLIMKKKINPTIKEMLLAKQLFQKANTD